MILDACQYTNHFNIYYKLKCHIFFHKTTNNIFNVAQEMNIVSQLSFDTKKTRRAIKFQLLYKTFF